MPPKLWVSTKKMTVKATENCVESLMTKGIKATDIAVLNLTVTLDTIYWRKRRIGRACQVDASSSSSENWFTSFLECMDVTEAELDTLLTESEEEICCLTQ